MKKRLFGLLAAAQLAMPMAAEAADIVSGTAGGLSWQAQSLIVGQTGTGTAAAVPPGNPIYNPTRPLHSGVVSLIMNRTDGNFICTGTLLPDRRSILTAAHCVSDGFGTANPIATTAYFSNNPNPDTIVHTDGASTALAVTDYYVHWQYTGEVIDQNDIAVLRLADVAPAYAPSHGIFMDTDLTGDAFNVFGYGARSDVGGAVGANLGVGRLRQGENRFDMRWGDPDFGGFFTGGATNFFGGTADINFSFVSDFDNGLPAQDASCQLSLFFVVDPAQYCDPLGRGALEVGVAGGDSGGPGFINGQIASVTSYGLVFTVPNTDFNPGLNSSWGEFSGFVPTYIHANFIAGAMHGIPEPGTWAMMLVGFGLVGGFMRRRDKAAQPAIA